MFLRLWDQQDEIGGARAHCLTNLKGWIPDIAGHKKKRYKTIHYRKTSRYLLGKNKFVSQ